MACFHASFTCTQPMCCISIPLAHNCHDMHAGMRAFAYVNEGLAKHYGHHYYCHCVLATPPLAADHLQCRTGNLPHNLKRMLVCSWQRSYWYVVLGCKGENEPELTSAALSEVAVMRYSIHWSFTRFHTTLLVPMMKCSSTTAWS